MLRIEIVGYSSQQVFEPSSTAKYSANPLLFGANNYVGLHYPMLQQLAALFKGMSAGSVPVECLLSNSQVSLPALADPGLQRRGAKFLPKFFNDLFLGVS